MMLLKQNPCPDNRRAEHPKLRGAWGAGVESFVGDYAAAASGTEAEE